MFPFSASSASRGSSAVDPSRYVALGLTHVQYDAQDPFAKLMALVTLSPIFLLCSYVTIILYRRELTFLNALVGQLGCEGVNWGLKRLIRQPRPHSDLGKGYGMPSSHSQFLGFFCAFFLAHFYLHHPRPAEPRTLVNTMRRVEHLFAMVAIVGLTAVTCYSRYHLSYHSPAQILVGISLGLTMGLAYYYLTEYLPRRPLRLPAPLGSPVDVDVHGDDFRNPFSDDKPELKITTGTATATATTASSSTSPRHRRRGNGDDVDASAQRGTRTHARRRSSLSSLMPELHPAPPIRQLILDHPLAVAFRLRDSWTVWLDGGIEGEYEAWRREWQRRRSPRTSESSGGGGGESSSSLAARILGQRQPPSTKADPASTKPVSSPVVVTDSRHINVMANALFQASQCEPTSTAFCVGCIVTQANNDAVVATGYSRELPGNTHAEQCALAKLTSGSSSGGDAMPTLDLNLYTSMEPCSERLSGAEPCAQRIIAFNNARHVYKGRHRLRITAVYQGTAEPADFIAENTGLAMLTSAGIRVHVVRDAGGVGWIQREAVRLAKYGHDDRPSEQDGDSRRWKELLVDG